MRITFAHDQKARKAHYQVRHATIREQEFTEVFSNAVVVLGQQGRVLKAVGRTFNGRFLTVVFLQVRLDHVHVITAWPSTRKEILQWHKLRPI